MPDAAGALADQFTRSWDMLLEAVRRFPDSEWRVASEDRMQPARLVYHLLFATERYTWLGEADAFLPQRKYNLDWTKTPVEDFFPSREAALQQVEQAIAATRHWLQHMSHDDRLNDPTPWSWTGDSNLAQGIYHLRHLQHHLAELNAELRKRSLAPAKWR